MLSDNSDSCNPVVRRIKYSKGGRSFHEFRGISYTTAKDIIKNKLGIFFDNLRKLGTHSLRSGGASDPGCSHLSDLSLQDKNFNKNTVRGVFQLIYLDL
jgi:hypothetical protein